MHVDHLITVRDWLQSGAQAPGFRFNMDWYDSCIAGYINRYLLPFPVPQSGSADWFNAPREYLGLTHDQAQALFYPPLDLAPVLITPRQAATAIQNLLDGRSPWDE